MVAAIAREFHERHPWTDIEDLAHNGIVGLIGAAKRWDRQRGVTFGNYAKHSVWGAMFDALRRDDPAYARNAARGTGKPLVALEELLCGGPDGDAGGDRNVPESLRVDPAVRDVFQLRRLHAALLTLPANCKLVIELYYCDGLQFREVADRMGLHESRISQIHRRALELLRQALAPDLPPADVAALGVREGKIAA